MAAGNGAQELEKLEAAITAARPRPKTSAEMSEVVWDAGTIVEFAEADARQAEALGRYLLEHGQYQHDACMDYARRKRAGAAELSATLEASDRRRTDEREKIMGKTGQ